MKLTLDTWLWVLAAAIPFAMGALGGHLSSSRRLYRWIFWICGIAGVFAVTVAGVRNQRAQTALQNQLDTIERNCKNPPTITVNPTPVTVQETKRPPSTAKLDFTFLPLGPREGDVKEISEPIVDGIATVRFTAKNIGAAQANNGQIWIQVCDACKFAEMPEGATAPPGDPLTRRKVFEHLHRGVYFEPTLLKIIPASGLKAFNLAFKYACDECPPLDNQHPQKLRVNLRTQ